MNKLCGRPPQYSPPRPLQVYLWPFDLETGVRESRLAWATIVPISVFLFLSYASLFST